VDRFVREELIPHELAEEDRRLPAGGRLRHRRGPHRPAPHTHREIVRLGRLLSAAVDTLDGPIEPDELAELRRLLYGLHAVITLHNAQEEEAYSLLDQAADPIRA
jgi:hypothetical protein